MALRTWWHTRQMADPVHATLRVQVCTQPDTAVESSWYPARIIGTLRGGPGLPIRPVTVTTTVPAARCPRPRQTVPIVVDRSHPDHMVIDWNRVPTRRDFTDY